MTSATTSAARYQIALGQPFTVRNPTGATGYGAMFSRGLARDLQTLADVAMVDRDRSAFLDHLGDPAPTGPPVFVDLNNAASYGPGVYVPHIAGIEIGRVVGTSTLVRLYLAPARPPRVRAAASRLPSVEPRGTRGSS